MPESAEQHGQPEVEVGAGGAAAVAAERNVEVVAKPTSCEQMYCCCTSSPRMAPTIASVFSPSPNLKPLIRKLSRQGDVISNIVSVLMIYRC